MRYRLVSLAACFALGIAICAQAASQPARQDKDKDNDAQAKHAQKAPKVKIIHGPVVEGTSTKGATIAWSTNVPASSILKYGTDAQNLTQTAEVRWGGLTHRVNLRNLQPGTTYYYVVESTQAKGTGSQTASGVQQFRTKGGTAAAAAATPAEAADARGRDMALRNFHQFLVSHPNVKADLQKNPNLAVNGRYRTQHPGFNQFLQTHHAVQAYLAQNPQSFLQSEDAMR
jgi:purple acid phosphatase-like protein